MSKNNRDNQQVQNLADEKMDDTSWKDNLEPDDGSFAHDAEINDNLNGDDDDYDEYDDDYFDYDEEYVDYEGVDIDYDAEDVDDYFDYDEEEEERRWEQIYAEREEIAQKNRREEAFLPSDGNGRHYWRGDLEKILSTLDNLLQNKDINKTALNSLYEYSRQDLCDYNNGELTISPNAVSLMKDFINIFGVDAKGNLNETGQKALENLEQQKNVMWSYERVQDIDFVHITTDDYPKFFSAEKIAEEMKSQFSLFYKGDDFEKKFEELMKDTALQFETIQKPIGGLWTSPNQDTGIPDWESFAERVEVLSRYKNPKEHWHIVPNDDCRIFVVKHDLSNLDNYMKKCSFNADKLSVDYDKIKEEYDAVYIPQEALCKSELIKGKYFDGFNFMDVASCVFLREKFKIMSDDEYKKYRRDKLLNRAKGNETSVQAKIDNIRMKKAAQKADNSGDKIVEDRKAQSALRAKKDKDAELLSQYVSKNFKGLGK